MPRPKALQRLYEYGNFELSFKIWDKQDTEQFEIWNHFVDLPRYTETLLGLRRFLPLQLDIIESVGSGRDTLGLMPTGGGKSITFQVPALAMEGVCIVVTPLIALMKDQVENLRTRGVKATAIYSGMSQAEILTAFENCELGDYKFLYVSPERLGTELFQKRLKFLKISMIAVDESHCISQWGYDFRPSYLKIADIREHLPCVPVLALTVPPRPKWWTTFRSGYILPKKMCSAKVSSAKI